MQRLECLKESSSHSPSLTFDIIISFISTSLLAKAWSLIFVLIGILAPSLTSHDMTLGKLVSSSKLWSLIDQVWGLGSAITSCVTWANHFTSLSLSLLICMMNKSCHDDSMFAKHLPSNSHYNHKPNMTKRHKGLPLYLWL